MLRSLIFHWRMNLAVVAGAATTTAIVTGALIVGDSMRDSLRSLSLDRLGEIENVVVNDRFIDSDLAARLALRIESTSQQPPLLRNAILLAGSALSPSNGRRASGVELIGIDESFIDLYPGYDRTDDFLLEPAQGQLFPSVVVNEPLQAELGIEIGDDLLVSFGRSSDVPSSSLLGRREVEDLLDTLRLTVTAVIPAQGPGRFGLQPRQKRTLNAYIDLSVLQKRIQRPDQVNTILISRSEPTLPVEAVDAALADVVEIGDLGLELAVRDSYLTIDSRELVIRPEIEAAIEELTVEAGGETWPVLTYLANRIEVNGRILPYSTITGFRVPSPPALGAFEFRQGTSFSTNPGNQIVLNSWAAEDLEAAVGDSVDVTYYLVGPDDQLIADSSRFVVSGIVEIQGLAADADLTPSVPGVSGAADMSSWDPPFPVDLDLVRPRDEEYWDLYEATPKAFIDLEAGQQIWQSRYGKVTSVRIVPEPGATTSSIHDELVRRLPSLVTPAAAGYLTVPVRQRGLDAASGTSDFSGLFAGFSLFLIVAAILLVVLLFALLVEQRGKEVGLLLALGYRPRRVRRRFLAEGAALATVGAVVGVILAILYAEGVLRGIEIWWQPLVESTFLKLSLRPATLLLGGVVSVALVLVSIIRSVRRFSLVPPRRLLAGQGSAARLRSPGRRSALVLILGVLAAATLLIAALLAGDDSSPALFFGIGSSLVAAGVAAFAVWCGSGRRGSSSLLRASTFQMAVRNSGRHPGRSLLSVALVASAVFVLVSVTANRKQPVAETTNLESGIGGLSLVAESDIPLPVPLDRYWQQQGATASRGDHERADRHRLGEVFSLRLLPGEDVSCLNLFQPEKPRILGVPDSLIDRGAFRFRTTLAESENPWTLLEMDFEDGAIPAIGDYNSVLWILHLGLGQDLVMTDESGTEIRLRLVGLLDASIFQSELLISEGRFIQHFPSQAGFSYFLVSTESEGTEALIELLEVELGSFGLDAKSTIELLASYHAVENMYLTTFEALGGLGLILGTLGLGVVLLRNVIERQGELATLRAFGFRRKRIVSMVVAENAFLLIVGLGIGTLSGLVAVMPHLLSGHIQVPWRSLGMILSAVFLVGLLASIAAVWASLRVPLLPALKTD